MKIRKSVILLIAFTIIPILVNAQTQYYKLQSYGKTGIENRKVSGGQFITFQAASMYGNRQRRCIHRKWDPKA